MKNPEIKTISETSTAEKDARSRFLELFRNSPIPQDELLANLGLFMRRQSLTHMLFMHELYEKALNVHGVVMELGVRWGRNLALFESFRGIHEPFNHNRKLIGFDTFSGFPSVHAKDGRSSIAEVGAYGVTDKYEDHLAQILDYHEQESPVSHIRKYQLVKGDATKTLPEYLKENPHTIVALAYFDLDLYEPTKKCLEAIRPHLTKGSVIGFDELNMREFPGETLALKEVLGLDRYRITRSRYSSVQSYLTIE